MDEDDNGAAETDVLPASLAAFAAAAAGVAPPEVEVDAGVKLKLNLSSDVPGL